MCWVAVGTRDVGWDDAQAVMLAFGPRIIHARLQTVDCSQLDGSVPCRNGSYLLSQGGAAQ